MPPSSCTLLRSLYPKPKHALVSTFPRNRSQVNREGSDGNTALMNATVAGQPATVAALIECGAKPDYENAANRTALILAAIHGKLDSLAALVTCGAVVDNVNREHKTALMFAVEVGRVDSIASLVRPSRLGPGPAFLFRAACACPRDDYDFRHTDQDFLGEGGLRI